MEASGRNSDNRMRHPVQHLGLSNNRRISVEALLPHLVTDDGDGMSISSDVLARLESPPHDRMDPQCVEIVGRDDTGGRAFRALPDAERSARDSVDDERVAKGAVPPKVLEVGP